MQATERLRQVEVYLGRAILCGAADNRNRFLYIASHVYFKIEHLNVLWSTRMLRFQVRVSKEHVLGDAAESEVGLCTVSPFAEVVQ